MRSTAFGIFKIQLAKQTSDTCWPRFSNFQVLYMFYSNFSAQVSTFHFAFKVQDLAHCFRILLSTFENTFQVLIWTCCRPCLRALFWCYTTPSTPQYQVDLKQWVAFDLILQTNWPKLQIRLCNNAIFIYSDGLCYLGATRLSRGEQII